MNRVKKVSLVLIVLSTVGVILSWDSLVERAKQQLVKEALKSATKSLPISTDSKDLMKRLPKGLNTGLSLPSMGGQ